MPLRPQTRRILLAAAFLIVIAALALLPPYVNGERYRRRIAESMSQSIGRRVHIDTVTFHLLPTAGITLGGLVVDENPAFGNEPVIRANVVEATLRLSSLWRRQIEISRLDFEVDDNGAGPSVNIVRNAEGRWNLQDILMQAAHANTAPTTQARHGDAPRFPYIEATGARVNLKLGDEKMPFSLVDADFALWSPSPQQWQIRLKARPTRTDANTSDTGTMTLEGTLGRAATLGAVPLSLTASWAHAPMGEATRVLTGDDQQWRGVLDAGATLVGTVAAAQLETTVHLTELRRADFVPADLLDVSAHCKAIADLTIVQLSDTTCAMPTGGPTPLTLRAATVDLQHPANSAATITLDQVPLAWLEGWGHLFTQNMGGNQLDGTLDGVLTHTAGDAGAPPQWQGGITANLQSPSGSDATDDGLLKPVALDFQLQSGPPRALVLQPAILHMKAATATLSGSADASQYSLRFNGTGSADQMKAFGNSLYVPLGDDLAAAMKGASGAAVSFDITCTRAYDGTEDCAAAQPAVVKKPRRRR